MTEPPANPLTSLARRHWDQPQHRNAVLLMANQALTAAAGLAFWLVLTRVLHLPSATIGVGYATVAVGTTIGVLARGGLDTALVRTVPAATPRSAGRLLALATITGGLTAVLAAVAVWWAAHSGGALAPLSGWAWGAAAAIGVLLVVTWLQDAWFLANGSMRTNLLRTLAASCMRVALPFLLVAWATPGPVAAAWAAALAVSALVGIAFMRPGPATAGRNVEAEEFLGSAARNMAGSAAEFLPGLLLAPMVLAIDGPAAAGYFGMAWTVASMLFLAAAAVGRSALAEMARPTVASHVALRRGLAQVFLVVGPGAVLGVLLSPFLLGVFGSAYAKEGGPAFAILCASIVVVAPASLYLALLRLRERTIPLLLLPLSTIALLLLLAPPLAHRMGLSGVALAWVAANTPFGLWAMLRLAAETKEVSLAANPIGGHPHLE